MKPSSSPMNADKKASMFVPSTMKAVQDEEEEVENNDEGTEQGDSEGLGKDAADEVEGKPVEAPEKAGGGKTDGFSLMDMPVASKRSLEGYVTHLLALGLDIGPEGWKMKKGRGWVEIPTYSNWLEKGERK